MCPVFDPAIYGHRTIFHIDVNSAFLSWTAAQRLRQGASLDLRTIPSVVGGDEQSRKGIVLAASIPAKRCGIKTGEPLFQARQKCPGLVVCPPDFSLFLHCSSQLSSLLFDFSPLVQSFSIDECFLDYTGMEELFGPPLEGAEHIRRRIKKELGFTVNIGVAPNKLLAKMASDLEKPDKIHTLYPEEIPQKMWPLPIEDLFMVGRSTSRRLRSMGIQTIGQLAHTDLALLERMLKPSHGRTVWHYANGIDLNHSMVKSETEQMKCISNSTTTPKDVTCTEDGCKTLLALTENVALRLRRQGLLTTQVSISLRYSDFSGCGRQMKVDATDCTRTIYQWVQQLFYELWDGRPLRHLGVSVAGLIDHCCYQPSLFDSQNTERLRRLDQTVDALKGRFGKASVLKASILDVPYAHSNKGEFHDKPLTHMCFGK